MIPRIVEALGWVDQAHWADRAACVGEDPDLWFPDKGKSTRTAKSICYGCPVRIGCLEYALQHRITFGIWGGLSERERRLIVRHRPVIHGTNAGYQTGCRCPECSHARAEQSRKERHRRRYRHQPDLVRDGIL